MAQFTKVLTFSMQSILACSLLIANIYLVSVLFSTLQTYRRDIPFYAQTIKPIKESFDSTLTHFNSSITSIHLPSIHTPRLPAPSLRLPQTTSVFHAPTYHTRTMPTVSPRKSTEPNGLPSPKHIVAIIITPAASVQRAPLIATSASAAIEPTPTHIATPTQVSAYIASAPSAQKPAPQVLTGTNWPLHGMVTTEFGVPEWPFQPIHTGMDISSAHPPGVMPIKPFREGIVAQVIHSRTGLGNHVIVDHGGGLTSYYCHLSSIAVQVGQTVSPSDTVGYEGRTGAVTGTHLHFEIRQNNIPQNPRHYIPGQP